MGLHIPYVLEPDWDIQVLVDPTTSQGTEEIDTLANIDFIAFDFTKGVSTSPPKSYFTRASL